MPVKERIIFSLAPTLFKQGIANYYAETLSAEHPTRLWGWDDLRGPIFS